MTPIYKNSYQTFKADRKRLQDLLEDFGAILSRLGLKTSLRHAQAIGQRLNSERFKILVIGDYNTGKSTFINALLGREILPQDAVPCTAVVSELAWGDEERAELTFKDPIPEKLAENLSEETHHHLENARGGAVPPLRGTPEVIADLVTTSDEDLKPAEGVESPYAKARFWLRHELFKNDLELIDSPGLDNEDAHTAITLDYLDQVDTVLFLISAISPLGQGQELFIEKYISKVGRRYSFFLCNRFDQLPNQKQKDKVRQRLEQKLASHTDLEPGLFCLSAQQALDGRLSGDRGLVEESGILHLETSMHRFLSTDRGKIKLLGPIQESKALTLEIESNRTIESRIELLEKSQADLEIEYRERIPKIEDSERKFQLFLTELKLDKRLARQVLRSRAKEIVRELVKELPSWVEELELSKQIPFLSGDRSEALQEFARDLESKLRERFEKGFAKRTKQDLMPLFEKESAQIESKTQRALQILEDDITKIGSRSNPQTSRITISDDLELDSPEEEEGAWSSVATAALAIGGAAAVFASPLALIPIVAGAGLLGLVLDWLKTEQALEEIQDRTLKTLQDAYAERADKIADRVSQKFMESIDAYHSKVVEIVDRRLDSLKADLESALDTKKEGEQEVQRKIRELRETASKVKAIAEEIGRLEEEVIQR